MPYADALDSLLADARHVEQWTSDRLEVRAKVSRELAHKNREELEAVATALEAVAANLRVMAAPEAALHSYLERLAAKAMNR